MSIITSPNVEAKTISNYAAINIEGKDFKEIPTKQTGTELLGKILNAVYTILGVIAVIVIVAAGIIYITSEGESQKTKMAKDAILYAAVGLVIVGSAFIITGVVQNIGH